MTLGIARKFASIAAFTALVSIPLSAQSLISSNGRGTTLVGDAFCNPVSAVPNAPFSAKVEVQFRSRLPEDSTEVPVTTFNIAREASGRTYDDKELSGGDWRVTSGHIYDPATRLNIFLIAEQHRATLSKSGSEQPEYETNPKYSKTPLNAEPPFMIYGEPVWHKEDLGTKVMEGVLVHGVRLVRNIPASVSGTGQPVETDDELWYSEELHINLLIKHTDPRGGNQTFRITEVKRGDPDPQLFQIPEGFRIVDLTPKNTQGTEPGR